MGAGKAPTAQTVDRALKLLDCFTTQKPEWTLTDLANEMNLHKSIVNRLVGSLEAWGYLKRNPDTKKLFLGHKILSLYLVVSNTRNLYSVSLKYMEQLRDSFNETVCLTVVQDYHGVVIARLRSTDELSYNPKIGLGKPLYAGSARKALLAHMPEAQIKTIIGKGLEKLTPNTITDPEILLKELESIRKNGYVVCVAEITPGGKGIAVPIWNNGSVIGSLSISAPEFRIPPEKERSIIVQLQKASQKISIDMGNDNINGRYEKNLHEQSGSILS